MAARGCSSSGASRKRRAELARGYYSTSLSPLADKQRTFGTTGLTGKSGEYFTVLF